MAKRKLDAVQTSDMIEQARREPEMTRNSINADAFVVLGLKNNDTLVSGPYTRLSFLNITLHRNRSRSP